MAPNPRTFMEISIDGSPIGRVIFELFADKAPRTAENFRVLCTGEAGNSTKSGIPLSYAGSLFHRVIPEFMLQCGDFTKKDGTGGESIYGGVFDDEDLSTPVDREGLLVMANKGPNTNGSQVFMTLAPAPHLDGKHCVFGKVVSGYEHLKTIEALPTDRKDRPLQTVAISRCGELELQKRPAESADARKASPPPRRRRSVSSSGSDSEDDRRRRKSSSKKKSRRHSDSDSSSGSDSDSEDDRRRSSKKKSSKRKHKSSKHKSSKKGKSSKKDGAEGGDPKEREETDAEMDARFEREDREKEAERKRVELEAIRARLKREEEDRQRSGADGGVRYKGRGAMRFSENAPAPVLPSYAREYHSRPAYNANHSRSDPNGASRDSWKHDLATGGSGERFVREKQPEHLGQRGGYEDRDKGAASEEKDTKAVEEAVAAGQAGGAVDEGPVMEEESVDERSD